MQTCSKHGDNAVVVFTDDENCPACKLAEQIDDLKDQLDDLNKENNELSNTLDEAVAKAESK